MNVLTLVRFGLLAFVGVGLAVAVTGLARDESGVTPPAGDSATVSAGPAPNESAWVAYYFHAPHRCPTCRTIEQYAHEALSPEIEQGQLEWRVADYTAAENRSLAKRFGVLTATVVLVHRDGGEIVRWDNLEKVWRYTSKQPEFLRFVRRSYEDFRGEA